METWHQAGRPAFSALQTRHVFMRQDPRRAHTLRTYRPPAPNCLCAPVVSDFAAHVFNSGQIGSSVSARLSLSAHFRKSCASRPRFLQKSGAIQSPSDSSFIAAVTWELCKLSCPNRLRDRSEKMVPPSAFTLKPSHLAQSDVIDQTPRSDVIEQSDFPREIAGRFFDPQKISSLRASGALRVSSFLFNDDRL